MRVLIIDDDPFVCTSLATILGAQDDVQVVGTGQNAADATQLYKQLQPDILLLDIQMGETSGLSAACDILADNPAARIIFLTTFAHDDYIVAALRLGAKGYLIKQDVAKIAPALRSVMAGQSVLGTEVLDRLDALLPGDNQLNRALEKTKGSPDRGPDGLTVPAQFASLSKHEYTIVELVAEGLDNREIAARLCVSEGTARNQISVILNKLGLKNRTQLAVAYYRGNRV